MQKIIAVIQRPSSSDYATFYDTYVSKVPDGDILEILRQNFTRTHSLLTTLPPDKWNHRYAPGKWNIKEVMIHLADAERIFAYRALRIARNDQTPLASFDENAYTTYYEEQNRTPESILQEWEAVRQASLHLLGNLSEQACKRSGTASGKLITVAALAYIIAGHEIHHMGIVTERYL